MRYTTTVTSKGTVTIAAPLRKALGIKAGQKLLMDLSEDGHRLVLDSGTNMPDFQGKRAAITKKIPDHLKGLAGEELQRAAGEAWRVGFND